VADDYDALDQPINDRKRHCPRTGNGAKRPNGVRISPHAIAPRERSSALFHFFTEAQNANANTTAPMSRGFRLNQKEKKTPVLPLGAVPSERATAGEGRPAER
jgi:hypothetical protein